ncbi:two-component system response regulator [Tersicoccus phoenicis]|uniref:Transcriptional regulatory protein n=1 Tax=Tersicoccus phoenicis TaxID=554083 RepID=A0A1R1LB08_9MICC|nr:response regulator [Tersicoccus phoenicis]OMH24668.1 two-component system response regulator [Tersicoccus phoenicis]
MFDVLVVDDDFMVARIHAGFVAQNPGFRVCGVAHSAAEALALTRAHAPDLVLLDIHLPDGNGLDLLHRLRREQPNLDAIVITAAREQATVVRARRGGVTSYLMKPFQREDLSRRLTQYRDQSGAADGGTADQTVVDRLFGHVPAARSVPRKGLSDETLHAVEEALRAADGDLSAMGTAERVGISRVSARRYLEHLVEQGTVTVQLRYGAGRPERRYAWPTAR